MVGVPTAMTKATITMHPVTASADGMAFLATGYAVWAGPAGATRQHTSDGHYEPTICSGINAGFDMAGVANGARGRREVTRQIDPAWADVGSAGLYPIARSE